MNDFNLIWEFNNLYNTKILKKVIIKNNKSNNNVNNNLIEEKNLFTQSKETSYLLNSYLEIYVNTAYDEKIQDETTNGVSHTIIKEDDKNIIFTFGGYKYDDGSANEYKSGTSESFSYFFTNLVYKYIFQVKNNEDINKIIPTINKIIKSLNLIFKLYNLTYKSNPEYINILLPIWQSYIDKGEIKIIDVNSGLLTKGDVGKYNATDSNQQLLLALFKLYFFNLENENNSLKYLCLITTGTKYTSKGIINNIEPILVPINSILGITFKDDKVSNILQKIIVIFIENVTLVKKFESENKEFPFSNGAFGKLSKLSSNSGRDFFTNYNKIFFATGVQPVDTQQNNTLPDQYFGDYINLTMYLYILKYYYLYIKNFKLDFGVSEYNITDMFSDPNIAPSGKLFNLSPILYSFQALSNYFRWLEDLTNINKGFNDKYPSDSSQYTKKDILANVVENGSMNAFYTRLLFQISEFLVLLNQGDKLLLFKEKSNSNSVESKNYVNKLWNDALNILLTSEKKNNLTDVINQLANNLFNIEINFDTVNGIKGNAYKQGLSFGFTNQGATGASYFNGGDNETKWFNTFDESLTGQGYYRLVLYKILIELNIITINQKRKNNLNFTPVPDQAGVPIKWYKGGNYYIENVNLNEIVSFTFDKSDTEKTKLQPQPWILQFGATRGDPPINIKYKPSNKKKITINFFVDQDASFFFGAKEKWWNNSGSYFDFYMMLINLTIFFSYNGNNLPN